MKHLFRTGYGLVDFRKPVLGIWLLVAGLAAGLYLGTGLSVQAQGRVKPEVDTVFVRTFPGKLTARTFLSQKYTSFFLTTPGTDAPFLRFRPNSALDFGIGGTLNALTLNLATGLSLLNNPEKGKTRDIDLQSHVYMRKWVVDGFGQFYKGYYLGPRGNGLDDPGRYYLRPDLSVNLVGASIRRVFNFRRFSFRSAMVQNEWQKRSAGTWLVGFQLYYGVVRGDSAFVPGLLRTDFPAEAVRRMRLLKVGPGVGYAYTYVYRQNWFATGSLTTNLNITFGKETFERGSLPHNNIRPDLMFRVVAGYNSPRWCVTAGWVNGAVSVLSPIYRHTIHTGNYRFTVARRFPVAPRVQKMVPEQIKIEL